MNICYKFYLFVFLKRKSGEESSGRLKKRRKASAAHVSEENDGDDDESENTRGNGDNGDDGDMGQPVGVTTHKAFEEEQQQREKKLGEAVQNLDETTFISLAKVRSCLIIMNDDSDDRIIILNILF